eukprot:5146478-Lingulodinium_polyedra.AAC.1
MATKTTTMLLDSEGEDAPPTEPTMRDVMQQLAAIRGILGGVIHLPVQIAALEKQADSTCKSVQDLAER